MRVLVCGGRDFSDRERVHDALDAISPSVVAQGGARGADRLAEDWCYEHCVPLAVYPANWDKYGHEAGPIRNQKMLDDFRPDLVVAFPGGNGTADMVRRARLAGVEVRAV